MSRILKKHARLVKLVLHVMDETATPSQEQELADLIRKDPEAQTVYLELIDIHSNLVLNASLIPATPSDALSQTSENRRRRKATTKKTVDKKMLLLATTCLLLICSTLSYLGYRVYSKSSETAPTEMIAQEKAGPAQVEQRMLEDGSLELKFPTGVKVLIAAESLFQITGNNSLILTQGMLFARVTTPAGKGFTVATPRGSIVDLGTVFGVEVDEKKSSIVQVFKGKVELVDSVGDKFSLSEGDTMFAEASANDWQPTENVSPRFFTAVQELNETFFPGISYLRSTKVTFIYRTAAGELQNGPVQSPSYIMFSATSVAERFRELVPNPSHWDSQARHFVEVRFNESTRKWQLSFKNEFIDFTPVESDVLIAQAAAHEKNEVGEWSRKVTLWEEESGTIHGIRYGDQMNVISIRPDWFSDKPDMGDFMIIKNIYYP
ncbi:FecR family protein [Gimesia maris]|uniref:FecR family protein n=1 Tax=Gimesia maris TaxID=122 RepID=UPI003A8F477B|tara:strand:+ start:175 stop:1479 length:1305 start_codon:yes stop_codon:yes gene_type:complete